ncbi:SwmB domain-containing protein [Massilia sp. LXY-6]|uniref:SwmB domain-containing protein n=1 Tax=Massilia sp. LXY-6 TaxID=3379823 RepID=UPI003EE0A7A5
MTTNFIGVLLPNSPNYTVNTGFSTELYDAEGGQTITVETGASLVLIGALGANTIRLAGSSQDWKVYRDGSTAIAVRTDGSHVELPANTTAQTLVFSDGSFDLRVAVSGSTATVMLGAQVLGTAPAPIGDAPLAGSVEKSAWTLVMTGSRGIYSSDGTAAGSKYLLTSSTYFGGSTVIANGDGTAAVVLADKLYGTDGTAAGTSVLASTNSFNSYFNPPYYRFGNKIVVADGGQSGVNAFVTDGTAAGTQIVADIPRDLVDTGNQALWGAITTGPYGRELFRTTITDRGAETVMVKDIASGSANGVPYSPIASLPDGRVVFAGNDGTSGTEPWVSDGTADGTYRLVDLAPGLAESNPYFMASLGGKVVIAANNVVVNGDNGSARLISTDGTPAGTKILDTSFPRYSQPEILGQVGDRLFFKAMSSQAGTSTVSIYSTDGAAIQKVADVGSNANMLAWNNEKAFFKVSDSAHGDELWVANFADGKFSLVKDILPGSGSALAEVYSGNVLMAGGKLAFTAYTSAATVGFFLSDGTEQGTWQVGNQRPSQIVVTTNTMVFADSEGLHAVNLTGAKATPVQLPGPLGTQAIQSDADQIYYVSSSGALYSWNGVDAPLALASKVSQFKVVAENAIYFTATTGSGSASGLWFSDGTAAGTHYVSALPQDSFDLSKAAALHTQGVAFPVENKAPVFASAAVNGATLTLSFSDDSPLDASHLPAVGAFKIEGSTATVTAVSVDANAHKVILTLSEAVKSADVLKLSYADPTAGNDVAALQDMHGNDAASFTGKPVQNLTADKEGPVLVSAAVDGATLTLTYNDANRLDAAHLPGTDAFKLEGSTATISGVSLDSAGKKLILSLSKAVSSGDVLKISYTDPTSGNDVAAIQDTLGNDAASLAGQAVENKTAPPQAKAPWTLLVASNAGLFASDGTTAGTQYVAGQGANWYSRQLSVNADHSGAVFAAEFYNYASGKTERAVLGFDGSGNAPASLSSSVPLYNTPIVLGKYLVFPDGGSQSPGLVTDGTAAGTHTVPTLKSGIVDTAHQVIWSSTYSDPYGAELAITRVTDSGAATTMVKDIWPGSSSGYLSFNEGILLDSGKLLFSGNDGVSGNEPWISDGTEAGTVRLADLQAGAYGSMPGSFSAFGHLAAFSADLSLSAGRELVVTDGTTAGTKSFDINPGWASSNPQMLGHVGDTLYFSASVTVDTTTTRALFSTDGSTVTRLVDINAGSALLGSTGTKTFFSISDAPHGAELWMADAAKGTIGLVKDILPGTGSGLSGDLHAVTVAGKLVFQAYTSASNQALFITDGSADGTIQLGGTLSANKTFGNMLVYADGAKVYGLDASAAAPAKVELTGGTSALASLQADADQAFFSLANGDLYATNGTASGTIALAHGVKAFKVVAENALYIVEQVTGGTGYGLSYSDGTAAGTYFVGYVDAELANNLDNSVVIKTIGVPPAH